MGGGDDEGGAEELDGAAMEEVNAILLEFLHTAAGAVEAPLPSGVLGSEDKGTAADVADVEGGLSAAAASLRAEQHGGDHAAVVHAFGAATLRRVRAYVELAQQLHPMLMTLQRISAALRARKLLREAAEGVTWTGAKHRLCSADVRKAARARALMLSGRGMPVLNADVWGMIFSFLVEGRGPRCAEVDEAAFAAGIAAAGGGGRAR